jgi:hypothetical protein
MTAAPIRHDLDIYNEACAFSVTSQSALERIIQSDDDMKGLFQKRLVIAQELVEDDEFSARVVVDDDLMRDEEGWLGRVTGILHIPCGKLLLCAGFDLDALYDFNRLGQNEYVHPLDVPPGTYQVDIYTYVNSINGGFCLPDTVKLGTWFRRSYPDAPFPLWLAAICEQDPSQDPEHEEIWADMEQSVKDGQITLDADPTALIDFVIQLRPLSDDVQLSSIDDTADGFFAPHTGVRLPDQFPLGVRSSTLPPNDYEMGLRDVAEDDKPATTHTSLTADTVFVQRILNNFSGHRIEDLQGGPLQQPLDLLQQLARLTWFCDPDADFVLYIRTPQDTVQTLSWPFAADLPRPQGDEIYIGVPWHSAQQRAHAIQEVSTFISTLPENSRIDFISANEDPYLEAGCQCYQSVIRHGQWHVTASYPPTSRDTLAAALDLCRTIDQPGPLYAQTEAEAIAMMDAAERSELFMIDFTHPQRSGRQLTIDDDCKINLALLVFRQRFGDTWNVEEAQIQNEASKAEFDAMLADIERAMAAPYDNERSRDGQKSKYFRANINSVPHSGPSQTLSALFQVWHSHHATSDDLTSGVPSIESIDVMMHAMGFDLLGDMLCERIGKVVMRGYACVDSQTFALLMVGTSGQHGLDFYTRFDDNSSQTTTSIAGMDDLAHAGIFRTSYPDIDYQTLYTLHLQHIEQKIMQGVQVQAITPTLAALAACMDEFLQRQGL